MKILVNGGKAKDFCIIYCENNTCSEYNVVCNTKICGLKCTTLTTRCIPTKPGQVEPFKKGELK